MDPIPPNTDMYYAYESQVSASPHSVSLSTQHQLPHGPDDLSGQDYYYSQPAFTIYPPLPDTHKRTDSITHDKGMKPP